MKVLLSLLLTAVCAQAAPAKRYMVSFKAGTPQAVRDRVLGRMGATPVAFIKSNGVSSEEFDAALVTAPAGARVAAPGRGSFKNDIFAGSAAESFADEAGVLIEEDVWRDKWIEAMPANFQNTPLVSHGAFMGSLQGLMTRAAASVDEFVWGIKRVKAAAAWDTTQGRGVKVAVIDTGIKTDHMDLSGQVVGGYNAIADTEKVGSYEDDNGHGTHVAGTIAAKRDRRGVVGIAPQVKLYAVKVLDKDGGGSMSDVIKGIIWCANNNVHVANMSLGSDQPSETLQRALRYAKGRGVVVVAAAGNSGGPVGYPAAYPETIAVAASNSEDKIAGFSSRGPEVDFIAPGEDIVSSWINGDKTSRSGTSMAAPHVAGLAALAVARGARGLGGPDGVLWALTKAAGLLPGLKSQEQGSGLIDASKLVQ